MNGAAARSESLGDQSDSAGRRDGNYYAPIASISVCLAFALLASPNPAISAVGILVPVFLWRLLSVPGTPAIFFFAMFFQWLQAFVPVLSANTRGLPLDSEFGGPELRQAVWLSIGAVIVVSLGIRLINGSKNSNRLATSLQDQSRDLCVKRLFVACLIANVASGLIHLISLRAGGLRQPILAFTIIKWMPIFLLAWTTLAHRRKSGWLVAIVVLEIIVGFIGYFSSFKEILFLLIVVALGVRRRGNLPTVTIMVTSVLCLVLLAFWQSVKVGYREALNQGTQVQNVSIPIEQRTRYLARSAALVGVDDLIDGLDSGVDRLGYLTYFAHCIKNVPANLPHQNGKIWFGALAHNFLPRALFPDKKVIDQSKRTMRYTGVRVGSMAQGTAVSIGFPGESYVDFGAAFMFVPIFVLGMLYGSVYRFSWNCQYPLAGVALTIPLLLSQAIQLAGTPVLLIGGTVTGFLAILVILATVVPIVWPLLRERQPDRRPSRSLSYRQTD